MVDDGDVTLLGAYYDPGAPHLSPAYLTEMYGVEFATAFAAGQAMAPEPGTAVMVALASTGLLSRRRRKSSGCEREAL
jgi:hypothetical protein